MNKSRKIGSAALLAGIVIAGSVRSGIGWVQEWGAEKREIKPGDVVWIPPGVKHWHGASATNGMRHIAIQETVDGRNVDWLEKVSDEQYGAWR